jgi:hypothetical protein
MESNRARVVRYFRHSTRSACHSWMNFQHSSMLIPSSCSWAARIEISALSSQFTGTRQGRFHQDRETGLVTKLSILSRTLIPLISAFSLRLP